MLHYRADCDNDCFAVVLQSRVYDAGCVLLVDLSIRHIDGDVDPWFDARRSRSRTHILPQTGLQPAC